MALKFFMFYERAHDFWFRKSLQYGISLMNQGFDVARGIDKGIGAARGITTLGSIPPKMLPTQGIHRNRTIYNKGNPFKVRPVTGSNPFPIYGSNPDRRPDTPGKQVVPTVPRKRRVKRRSMYVLKRFKRFKG